MAIELIAYPQDYGDTITGVPIFGGGVTNGQFNSTFTSEAWDYDTNGNVYKFQEAGKQPTMSMQGFYSVDNSNFSDGIPPTFTAGKCILEVDGSHRVNGGGPGAPASSQKPNVSGFYLKVTGMIPLTHYTITFDVTSLNPYSYPNHPISGNQNSGYEWCGVLDTGVGWNSLPLASGTTQPYYAGNVPNAAANNTACQPTTPHSPLSFLNAYCYADTPILTSNTAVDYFCSSATGEGVLQVRFRHVPSWNGQSTQFFAPQYDKIEIDNLSITSGTSMFTLEGQSGAKSLDLYTSGDIPLVLNVDDFKKVNTKFGSYSKNFLLPMTKKNNLFFKHAFEVTMDHDFNVYKKTKCLIKDDSLDIFSGFMQLINIKDIKGKQSYEVVVFADNVSLQTEVANKRLSDINFNEINHEYTATNIEESWSGNLQTLNNFYSDSVACIAPLNGVVGSNDTQVLKYPLVDWTGLVDITTDTTPHFPSLESAFRPWVNCLYLMRRIIKDAGFTYTSPFMDSNPFAKLYMDMNWGSGINISGGNFNFNFNAFNWSGSQWATQSWQNMNLNGVSPSNQGWWDTSTDEFSATIDGQQVYVEWSFRFYNDGASSRTINYRIQIYDGVAGTWSNQTTGTDYVGSGDSWSPSGNFSLNMDENSGAPDKIRFQFNQNTGYSQVTKLSNKDCNGYPGDCTNVTFSTQSYNSVNVSNLLTTLRGDMTQWEFTKGLLTMFNLMVIPSKDDHKHIEIIPWRDYSDSGVIHDWTGKIDTMKMELKPVPGLSKNILFSFEPDDSDWYLRHYTRQTGEVYGQATVGNTYEVGVGEEMEVIATPFAPTIIDQIDQTNWGSAIVPRIFDADDSGEEPEGCENLPRILFDNGEQTGLMTYDTDNTASGTWMTNQNKYGLFTPFENFPTTGTGMVATFGYSYSYFGGFISPAENLYTEFWDAYIQELYHKDTRVLKASFMLSGRDIHHFEFKDLVRIKNKLYRVNKIEYKSGELSKCELITVNVRINE